MKIPEIGTPVKFHSCVGGKCYGAKKIYDGKVIAHQKKRPSMMDRIKIEYLKDGVLKQSFVGLDSIEVSNALAR